MVNRLLDGEPLSEVLKFASKPQTQRKKSSYDIDEVVKIPTTGDVGIVESFDDIADTYRLRDKEGNFLGVYESTDLEEAEEGPQAIPDETPPGPPPISSDSPFDRIKTEYAATLSLPTTQLIPMSNFMDDLYGKKADSDWIVDGKPNPVILKKIQKYLDAESEDM